MDVSSRKHNTFGIDLSMKTVFVLSDATGETAERMVEAVSRQFSEKFAVETHSRVRLENEVEAVVERAAEIGALVVFTMVNAELRSILLRHLDTHNVEAIDLMGALMGKLSAFLSLQPSGVPGLLHTLSEEYFRRIEAVEFAVKNDDGAEPRNLPKADLVLVGISRTSKTPLSTYLAQRGLRVANVPLVLGIEPPKELSQVEDSRVYGLMINPDNLVQIRQARLKNLAMPTDASYGARAHIDSEIAYSREIFRKNPKWPVIDVTNRAIEETAANILRLYRERVSDIRNAD